jgi:hypothetical protein
MSYARAYRSGSLGEAACPDGFFQSCLLTQPGKPAQCSCLKTPPAPTATAVMTQQASTHWGLIAAGILAGLVIYKFVL